jgi:predicted PurR-regulated permease PerM
MGAPHQFDGVKTLSPRARLRSRRKPTLDRNVVERHLLFWLAVLVLVVLALWLLSEILLPFVAGLAIAYLLTPLTDRLERFGSIGWRQPC